MAFPTEPGSILQDVELAPHFPSFPHDMVEVVASRSNPPQQPTTVQPVASGTTAEPPPNSPKILPKLLASDEFKDKDEEEEP